jgi:peptide/nickel transport system substrate-binding protein
MSRRVLLPLVAVLAAAGACTAQPPDPDGITLAIDSGPANLDPRLGSDESSRRFQDLVFNSLVRTGDDARPVPDLASAIETPDASTVIVRLRAGVRFHDGATLTSADVADTYRSILEGRVPSFRRGDLEAIAAVETPDPATVVFRLGRPFVPLVSNLTVPILKAGTGAEAARRPIGTGPFRLTSYRKDEDLLLERFADYFEGPAGPASVRLRIIPSETARLLELLTGGVDMVINDLPPDGVERIRRTPGFRVLSKPGRNAVYMAFNLADPILRDARVREAIACALDPEAVVVHLLHGTATLATGLLPPGHWAYNSAVARTPHDLERAARLLDAAGWPDPDGPGPAVRFRVEYKAPSNDLARQQAEILQAQLAAAGIGVDVRTYEWATFYEDLKAGRFQIVVSNWTDISDPDVYRLRFHSAAMPPAGLNRGGYRSAEADRLIEAGAAASDIVLRRQVYGRLQEVLAADRPYVVLWHRDVIAILGARVGGFELLSGADFRPLWRVRVRTPGAAAGAPSADPSAERRLEGPGGDRAGAHEARRVDGQVDHGRGAAPAGRTAVEHETDHVAERGRRLLDGGRRRLPRAVGAGGDDRAAGGAGQRGGDRMGRHPHPDGVAAAEQTRRQIVGRRQDERQRSGPEGLHEPAGAGGDLPGAQSDGVAVAGDQRQGHPVGPPLGFEDAVDGRRVTRVAGQAVEGLRRVDDQEPAPQQLRGARDGGGIRVLRVDAVHLGRHANLTFGCVGGATIAQAWGAARVIRAARPGLARRPILAMRGA